MLAQHPQAFAALARENGFQALASNAAFAQALAAQAALSSQATTAPK